MPIDWFTVVAQSINFLILVWLLQRFLYKPILDAIDAREKGIVAQLASAEAMRAEAIKERDSFLQKNSVIDRERASLEKKVTDEAHAERLRLFEEARRDAESLRSKHQDALRSEHQHLSQEMYYRIQKEVFAISRKTLAVLANANLEDCMSEEFIHRLRSMDDAERRQLAADVHTAPDSVRVRSAFDLPTGQRTAIERVVRELFSTELPIPFETAPELIAGIELSTNGQKVAWSIAEYLDMLEKCTRELLPGNDGPALKPVDTNATSGKTDVAEEPSFESTREL